MKKLVLYYSLDGNTKSTAEDIAKEIGADLYGIEMVKKMPKGKFAKIMTGGMYSSFGICPKLKEMKIDIESYDEIILGTPVWAGKSAAPIWGFVKNNKADEKITSVFTFSGSGNNDGCINQLKKVCPNIKNTVSLVDKAYADNMENDSKLKDFIEKL
jgi:flavodoxin